MTMTAALSIADALKSQAVAGVTEALFRNSEVISEFPIIPFTGGSTINVKMHYAGNASVKSYVEGDAPGVAGSQSYLTALWPETHYWGVVGITGHAIDYTLNGSNEAVFYNQVAMEMSRIMPDITHQMSLDMLGTGQTAPIGIQGIVSSTGTIAGINRATFTWFAAYQVAGAATTIAASDLDLAMFNSSDATYAGMVSEIWTSWKQSAKLKIVLGNAGVANNSIVVQNGQQVAIADVRDPQYYGSTVIKKKRNLTNSIFLGLTKEDFFIGQIRGWTVEPLARVDDSQRYLVTCGYSLGCRNPKRSFKVDTLTA